MRIDGALEKAGFEVLDDTGEGAATMFEGKVWWNSDHNVYKIYLNGAIRTCVDNRLIGSAANEIDMGDFDGSTINSDQSVKECLQDLETKVDGLGNITESSESFSESSEVEVNLSKIPMK